MRQSSFRLRNRTWRRLNSRTIEAKSGAMGKTSGIKARPGVKHLPLRCSPIGRNRHKVAGQVDVVSRGKLWQHLRQKA